MNIRRTVTVTPASANRLRISCFNSTVTCRFVSRDGEGNATYELIGENDTPAWNAILDRIVSEYAR